MRTIVALVALSCAEPPDLCTHPPLEVPIEGALAPGAARVIEGLRRPTQMQFDETGRLWVLEGDPTAGKALVLFDRELRLVERVEIPTAGESTGLLVLDGGSEIYVASRGRVDRFASTAYAGVVIGGLPHGGHTNNGISRGPDGLLYFGIGSTCDACVEDHPLSGTIVRWDRIGAPEVYARGVRNAYAVAFAADGSLFATDNGPDCCRPNPACTQALPDRLLRVEAGAHYGWPYTVHEDPPPVTVAPSLVDLPLHAGATGLALCPDGKSAYVALWGEQHAESESGRRVVRVRIEPRTVETVLGPAGLGHPIAVALGPDGSLYVLDYLGFVVRVNGDFCG